jgi:hypothetical protein
MPPKNNKKKIKTLPKNIKVTSNPKFKEILSTKRKIPNAKPHNKSHTQNKTTPNPKLKYRPSNYSPKWTHKPA